mmetsp:Transcript_115437/g.327101  ORF Transcript_115437/g.327101 Transcript_115437/m.327101 type:complete len:392 (+) Transcript_115437:296-1471(+)
MSTSPTWSPAFTKTSGMAKAGPMPITSGGTPTSAEARRAASTGMPSSSAFERRIRSTAAAPSVVWLELPAVVEPSGLKAGFSFARASRVVARMPSSLSTSTDTSLPSSFRTFAVMGTISLSKSLPFCARAALCCDSKASLSWSSRLMPYLSETFSLVMPIGRRVSRAMGMSRIFWLMEDFFGAAFLSAGGAGADFAFGAGAPKPLPDIFSTPAPMPMSMTPVVIWPAIWTIVLRPLEHCRFCVAQDTVSGKPARNLAGAAPAKPFGLQLPTAMSSTRRLSSPTLSQTAASTGARMSSGGVSLKDPLLALASADRSALTMTTSFGSFLPMAPMVCPGLAVFRISQFSSKPEAPFCDVATGATAPTSPPRVRWAERTSTRRPAIAIAAAARSR